MMKKISFFQGKRCRYGLYFVLPHFIGVSIFFLVPYIDLFGRAFRAGKIEKENYMYNFELVIHNEAFQLAVNNTIRFIVCAIPILLIISLILAILLGKMGKVEKIVKKMLLVPMAVPIVSLVLLWEIMFDSNGFMNSVLYLFEIDEVAWMHTKSAFYILMLTYIWKNLGYYVVLWMAVLASVPKELYEAAQLDGAKKIESFLFITIPYVRKSIFMIVVLAIVNSFKVFREAYLVAGDYPHDSMYLLQHLFNNWFRNLQINQMAAGAVLTSLVIFIFVFMFQLIYDKEDS